MCLKKRTRRLFWQDGHLLPTVEWDSAHNNGDDGDGDDKDDDGPVGVMVMMNMMVRVVMVKTMYKRGH